MALEKYEGPSLDDLIEDIKHAANGTSDSEALEKLQQLDSRARQLQHELEQVLDELGQLEKEYSL